MSKTRDEMILRVLTKLGHNQPGQTAATEDKTTVEDNLETIFAELAALKIFYVSDYDSYEDDSFEPLSEYLASYLCEDFDQSLEKWAPRRASALNRLELIAAPSGTGETLKTDPMLRAGAYRYGHYTGG